MQSPSRAGAAPTSHIGSRKKTIRQWPFKKDRSPLKRPLKRDRDSKNKCRKRMVESPDKKKDFPFKQAIVLGKMALL